jgi:hypothetical protein
MPRSNAVELIALQVNVVETRKEKMKKRIQKNTLLSDILEVCN